MRVAAPTHVAWRVGLALVVGACQPSVQLPQADARSGFEVDVNGFSFPNFGGESETARLNPTLVARMYGAATVCTSPDGVCKLTPLANQWMTKVNESMKGGRCEGFAVLSGLFYEGVLNPADFGANDAFDLKLTNRPQLSREIAYWFSTQFLRDVVKESTKSLDARAAVALLSERYQQTPVDDLYRVGMVRVGDGGKVTGGHAMVATAVLVDEAGKRFRIQVYDNNHPGEARFIEVDAEANTWAYQASSNPKDAPSLYTGTPANKNLLYLAPLKNRTGQQRCAFCGLDEGDAQTALNQIFSFGSVEVAAVDAQGNATGVVNGQFVNTLPGASLAPNFSLEPWEDAMPPIVFVPARGVADGRSLSFRVTGTGGPDAMHMTMFGAGFSVGVSGAAPPVGASDVVAVSNGGTRVSVTHAPDAGGEFTVSAIAQTEDGGQTQVELTIPPDAGFVDTSLVEVNRVTGNSTVEAHGPRDVAVEVSVVRSAGGEDVVIEGTMTAPAVGSLQFNIAGYSKDAGVLEVTVDQDGDGTADMTVPVQNHGPDSPPAPPSSLSALPVSANRVQLTWRDASRYETNFVVERALGTGAFSQLIELPADTESYLDVMTVASTAYRYRVRATNAAGASDWSSEVSVSSPECPAGTQDHDQNGTCEPSCSASTTCDAHATCNDASGAIVCTCAAGFAGDGTSCTDVDECATNNGDCGDARFTTCTNNVGAAPTCADIDECATNNGGCGDARYISCTNKLGSAPTCTDIDECSTNNGGCGDARYTTCSNHLGGAPTCTDIDECSSNNGGCGDARYTTCANNLGAPPTCGDIDECLTNNGGCGNSLYTTCTNNLGAAPTCTDLNECLTNNGGCGDALYTQCTNNLGSAQTCTDIDECATNNGNCGDARFTACTNNVGAAATCTDINECASNNGGCGDVLFISCSNNVGAAPTCTDIDECANDNGGCGTALFTTCVNNVAAAPTCTDIDECLTNNGGCGDAQYTSCTNNQGGPPSCADINECLTNNGGCGLPSAAICTDRVAAPPTCLCLPGYSGASCATHLEFVISPTNPITSETVLDLVRDAAGNLYLALQVTGPTDFGNGVTLAAYGGNDVAIVSFTPAGQARWGVLLGSAAHDSAAKLAIDSADNLYVTGTSGLAPFWVSASDSLGTTGGFVASYTAAGVYRWSRAMASEARSIAVSSSGNVTVAGWANGSFDYGLGVQQARGAGDLFIVTYTNDGQTTLWAHVYGSDPAPSTPDNSFDDLAYDSSGNLYAAGHLGGPNGNLGGATLPFAGQQTAVLASYTSGGAHRWSKALVASGSSSVDSAATSIAVDSSGHLATFVRFRDSIDLGGGTLTTPSPGVEVGALAVFATVDGAFVAQRGLLTGAPVMAFDLHYDSSGNVYVAGNANNGGADLGAGPMHSGAFVAGYDGALGYRFAKVASGGAYPTAQALVLADDGDVYAAGTFDNTSVSWGVGSVVEASVGSDLWLARMHPMLPVTSGLVAHYNAREPSGFSLSGSTVTSWFDLSGSGHPLGPNVNAPNWVATGINGRAALDFATAKGLISQPFSLTTMVTVFMVASWGNSPDTWGNLAHHGSRDMDWSLERSGSLANTLHFQSVNDNAGVQLVCKPAEPMLLVGTISGTTRTLRLIDATGDHEVSGTGVSIGVSSKSLWVGRSDVGESSNSLIGEFVYFNRALTPAETTQLITDLTASWGIAHP